MSVIIRLQNLAWSANASDIREFFKGLSVPEGGVHIVGGEMGDAFIAFSTDEDARLGMMKTGEMLKCVQVTLSLSSRTQMQKIIEAARQQVMAPSYPVAAQPIPVPQPLPFSQATPSVTISPMIQTMPQSQPNVQQEPKPDSSMYRTEPTQLQNFGQQPFQNQPQQYPQMFPGAVNIKSTGNPGDNYQGKPMQPSNQIETQYLPAQSLPSAVTPKPAIEVKEKTSTVTNDKQVSEPDKRERRRDDYSRDRKDRESRDDRRRRSKSRSRSRERRRRHRSRSRDRSSRYRRSRSRDRDRGKEKDRRDREKRTFRDNREKRSQESTEIKSPQVAKDSIPGLGEIPAEIPKDSLTIITESPNEPVTRTPHTRWGGGDFNKPKEKDSPTVVDMEIETVDMEIEKVTQDVQPLPQINQPPPFMRQPPPQINHPSHSDQQPVGQDRQPPQEALPQPLQKGTSLSSHNGRPGLPNRSAMNSSRNLEESRFSSGTTEDSFRAVGSDQRSFDPQTRGYDGSFREMNMRSIPIADGPFERRHEWSQGNFQYAGRSQRPDNSWNNNEFNSRQMSRNFERPLEDNHVDFWNGSVAENQNPVGFPDRSGHRRFSGQEFCRGSDNRNSYDRGRRGIVPESGRVGGHFYDNGSNEYQEDGRNYRERGTDNMGSTYRGRDMATLPIESGRKPKTCCIELLNVPLNASYKAIRDVFYGIPIPNATIKIQPETDGRRSTTAFMRFSNTMDATEAFKRRLSYIGNNQICINFIDESKYEKSIDFNDALSNRRFSDAPLVSNCIKIIGLPQACTDSDIAQIFAEFRIVNIVVEPSESRGEFVGSSFVAFSSGQEAETALRKLQGVTLDGNYLKGETCHENVMNNVLAAQRQRPVVADNKNPINEPIQAKNNPGQRMTTEEIQRPEPKMANRPTVDLLTDSVVIKQVPCDLPKSSIHDFFSDEGIVPERVYFGEPSKDKLCDVYVVFPLVDHAPKAVLKTGQMLGPVKALIELISKPSVMRILGLPFDPLELFKKSNKSVISENSKKPHPNDVEVSRQNSKRPDRSAIEETHMQRLMDVKNNDRTDPLHQQQSRDRPLYQARPNYPQQQFVNKMIPNLVVPDRFGKPGCVVALGDIPRDAEIEDILHFFRDFPNMSPNCVIRRFDEIGRPTADARVSMASREDATRAVNILNRQYMLNRSIYVSLVS